MLGNTAVVPSPPDWTLSTMRSPTARSLPGQDDRYIGMLKEVTDRTGRLVALWQVGLVASVTGYGRTRSGKPAGCQVP